MRAANSTLALNLKKPDGVLQLNRIIHGHTQKDSQLVQQSTSNEHYTPQQYVEAARSVLGEIDLDPASNHQANKVIKAGVFARWRRRPEVLFARQDNSAGADCAGQALSEDVARGSARMVRVPAWSTRRAAKDAAWGVAEGVVYQLRLLPGVG
jgi:hypothetical protein